MSAPTRPEPDYRFLDWTYAPETRRLRGAAGDVRLKPLSDRLLRQLLDAPGAVLARDRLIDAVWTRREVNDEVLSRAIAELRGLIGDDAREPRYIETLSKGGYRWIAPVTRADKSTTGANDDAGPMAQPRSRRRRPVAALIAATLAVVAAIVVLRIPRDGDASARASARLLAAQPLTADPRAEIDARFDAAGHVVYIRGENDRRGSALVMIDPATRAGRVLWQDDANLRHPAPAPDGRAVAVMRRTAEACELWLVALVDLARTRLGDCARTAGGGIEWVDDDRLIVTGEAEDERHAPGLVLLDRHSGARRALTRPVLAEGEHGMPRLSRDRTRLVHASRHDGETQLWESDWPALATRRALLGRHEPVFGHAFEAGGHALWVAGDLTLYRALHRLDSGAAPQLLGGRGAISIDLAPDGRAVWSEARYDADILVRAAAGAPWKTVAASNRYETQPAFSPDGTQLALVSNRDGSERVFITDLHDGSTRALPLDTRWRWVRPTWSMREAALILTAYEDHGTRLYRYRLDAASAQPVAHVGTGAFHGHELDDRLVWLAGHGSERGTLMQLREGHAEAEDLGLGDVAAYRASADWLVWRTRAPARLMVANWRDPGIRRGIALGDDAAIEAFAVAGATLTWVDAGRLWTLRLPDGEAVELDDVNLPDGNGPNLATTADGALAMATLVSVGVDLMLAPAE